MLLKSRVCQHFRMLGTSSRESSRFTALIQKWNSNNGPEWTVKRLKSLEQYVKKRLQGIQPDIPSGWGSITTRRYASRFKDDLMHELFSRKDYNPILALQFARSATGLYIGEEDTPNAEPTTTQYNKFITAVTAPPIENGIIYSGLVKEKLHIPKDVKTIGSISIVPLMYDGIQPSKTSPVFTYEGKLETRNRTDSSVYSTEVLYSDATLAEWFSRNVEFVSQTILGNGNLLLPKPDPGSAIFSRPIGTIGYIQEPGCKLRAVASPFLVIQAINEPLKVTLKALTRSIKQIVTLDQDEGRATLFEWISSGIKVWSYDASSFTDRFPLKFQLECLKILKDQDLISREMIEVFEISSKKRYFDPISGANVAWEVGQPQGLGPSFHTATISHYMLLVAICDLCNTDYECFRIVGDDIIINNELVSSFYSKWMEEAGVEINMDKSIISDTVGEFAGTIVTRTDMIDRPKMRPLDSNDKVVSLFDLYKHGFSSTFISFMMNDFESQMVRKLNLPEDFGGRRLDVFSLSGLNPSALNQFKIGKQRLIKDLTRIIGYDRKAVAAYLEGISIKRTGILHSTVAWTDDASREIVIEEDIFDFGFLHKCVQAPSEVFKTEDRAYITDVIKHLETIKRFKTEPSLRHYIHCNSEFFSSLGYVLDLRMINPDHDVRVLLSSIVGKAKQKTLSGSPVKGKDTHDSNESWVQFLEDEETPGGDSSKKETECLQETRNPTTKPKRKPRRPKRPKR